MLNFVKTKHCKVPVEHVAGNIVYFADEGNEMPLNEQFDKNYGFGGGWRPFEGFVFDPVEKTITYPEDPKYYPMAIAKFRDQEIIMYEHAWVLILNADGSFEVSRMD